jgi:hypothetical protein
MCVRVPYRVTGCERRVACPVGVKSDRILSLIEFYELFVRIPNRLIGVARILFGQLLESSCFLLVP